jgi:hypothetical protein
LELERGRFDPNWLKEEFDRSHRAQIRQHIQFADYWYSANGRFTDLQAYCSEIAEGAGLRLDAQEAFRWLATGGFASEEPGMARAASFRVGGVKFLTRHFSGEGGDWEVARFNEFRANLVGAVREEFPLMAGGEVVPATRYRRDEHVLPLANVTREVWAALSRESDAMRLHDLAVQRILDARLAPTPMHARALLIDCLEALLAEGWVKGSVKKGRPFLTMFTPEETSSMHPNRDALIG